MDPEGKKLLEESIKLGEENNKLLRSLHRSMRIRRVVSIIYWVFIIGSAVGAYYFIEPYVDGIKGAYTRAGQDIENFRGFIDGIGN